MPEATTVNTRTLYTLVLALLDLTIEVGVQLAIGCYGLKIEVSLKKTLYMRCNICLGHDLTTVAIAVYMISLKFSN